MRRLAAFGLVLAFLFAGISYAADIEFPPLTGRVVDQVGVLDAGAKQQLTQALSDHEARTGQQVVVVIVKSLQGQTIEDYGYQLGRNWGIGQKDKDTGAILLVAPAERKVRIEVGYGLEGQLTDAKSADIIQGIILPAFKQGQMSQGIVAGTRAVLTVLGDSNAMPTQGLAQNLQPADTMAAQNSMPANVHPLGLIIFALFLFVWIFILMRGGGSGRGLLLGAMLGSQSWGGGGGGFSGGGFSGGGGSFGGGGASGSW